MAPRHVVYVLTPADEATRARIATAFGDAAVVLLAAIRELPVNAPGSLETLVAFGTGEIVPPDLLKRFEARAYNVHGATPAYPGRDPHHFAAYDGARRYGATLHVMSARVDEGAILDVEWEDVPAGAGPARLLEIGRSASLRLLQRWAARLASGTTLSSVVEASWGARKTTRADLHRMSAVTPLMDQAEFQRRLHAFDGDAYDNLTVDLHGATFRIDKRRSSATPANARSAFTEADYIAHLRALRDAGYAFARYGEATPDPHVLWRHDIDFSPQRAARLAALEAAEGARGTYFFNARSDFYNLAEPAVRACVAAIAEAGHDFGLHFDAAAFPDALGSPAAIEAAVARERVLVEMIIGQPLRAVSWHNPGLAPMLAGVGDDCIAGLVNAYSDRLKRDYVYCSDSNGFWRFQPMRDVIAAGHPRLHLLTHPGWWTPEAMSPSERIDRALLGRARAIRRAYDDTLRISGRENKTA